MKRFAPHVQVDDCPRCGAKVLTASWDELLTVADSIVADPTVLSHAEEVACVLTDRSRYVLERTAAGTYRLGRITEWLNETRLFDPALHLPAHRCGGRFPTALPDEHLLALVGLARTYADASPF